MGTEVNGRPGGIQHPEEGSKIQDGDGPTAKDMGSNTGGKHSGSTGGAEHLEGADAYGDKGAPDLGRGGD